MPGRFELPIKIKEIIDHIDNNDWCLPAFQREFTWSPKQISRLFDSIMKDLPIGSFLFWQVPKSYIQDSENYPFFQFRKEFSTEKIILHPQATIATNKENVYAVLDGQQRISSLYMGLRGGYKINTSTKKYLHLNLLSEFDSTFDSNIEDQFKFMTEYEREKENEEVENRGKRFWYSVSKVLQKDSDDLDDLKEALRKKLEDRLDLKIKENKTKMVKARKALDTLYHQINTKPLITFYLETGTNFDSVAKIFIRTNSSGKTLAGSDILLSTAVATWNKRNVRQEVDDLRKELNLMGNGFNFKINFILKSWLTLVDKDISVRYNVDNYTKPNMEAIERKWSDIQKALKDTVRFVVDHSYSKPILSSHNAIIPIAYYLMLNNKLNNYLISNSVDGKKDGQNAVSWLRKVLIKGLFDGASDAELERVRRFITKYGKGPFPYNKKNRDLSRYEERDRPHLRSLIISNEDIKELLDLKYNKDRCFWVLLLLDPSYKLSKDEVLDHIFPLALSGPKFSSEDKISEENINYFKDHKNDITNLQPLTNKENRYKGNKMPDEWVKERFNNPEERKRYLEKLIGKDDLSLISPSKLKEFFIERKDFIKQILKSELQERRARRTPK